MKARHRRGLAFVFVLAACGQKEATPAGPVGTAIDLRAHVPADVRVKAPADDKAKRNELPVDVHGIKAKLVWRTFEDGAKKYIVSAQWEVVTPAPGVTLESNGVIGMPTNAGTPEATNEQLVIGCRWHDNNKPGTTSLGDKTVSIRADGTGQEN